VQLLDRAKHTLIILRMRGVRARNNPWKNR
jgi:hypothetical protein